MAKWWLGLSLLGLICLVLARLEFGEIHMLLSLQSLRIGISNDTEVPSPATASPTLLSSTTASPTLPLTPSPTLLLTLLSPTATNSPTSWSTCSREYYGDLLLTQWQSNRESYCQEPGSQFHCAKYLQYTRNKPDYVCEFRNGQFDQGKIHLGCKLNGKIREQHHVEHLSKVVSSKDDAKPASEIKYTGITSPQYLAFMDQVHITHRPTRLVGNHTGQWEELKQGETVIFVGRDCNGPPFNPWHCFASILDAYQTIVQFNLAYNATSFVFLDRAVPGPFHLMWQALGKQHLTQAEWSRLSQPLVVDHGILLQTESFIWIEFWTPTVCPYASPLLASFRTHMSQSLPELIPKATYDAYVLPPGKQLRITIPVRLPNQEKRRNLANLKELVAHLELAFPTAHVLPLVFHELHFTAQVAVMYHTDVLLGVHGGAMTNMLFLQPNKGLVLELHPQSSVAHCYQNMAQHAGIPYRKLLVDDSSGESKPNVQQVSQLVKELFAAYR